MACSLMMTQIHNLNQSQFDLILIKPLEFFNKIFVEKFKTFNWKECVQKCHLQNFCHSSSGLNVLNLNILLCVHQRFVVMLYAHCFLPYMHIVNS